jgi:cyclopropane-fatty-acyl-phospholipid synthase
MLLLDKLLRRVIKRGQLIISANDGKCYEYGEPASGFPEVSIRFTDARVGNFIARNPRLGAGEAFIDGRLLVEQGDILDLVRLLRANTLWEIGKTIDPNSPRLWLDRVIARIDRFNWDKRSKANVAHHYDLGDQLYRLFLDEDMQYSCAYFTDPANSLEQAQADKKAHIIAKLNIQPGQHVLDIGCGWGGMALTMHAKTGARVTGITLSEQQLTTARRRAQDAGVTDRVDFQLIDYRALSGQYDRIVSVGMFEHVGSPHFGEFFAKCRKLLKFDGVMLLHTIGRMGKPGTTDAFTRKYIFPGGYIPALSETLAASEQQRLIATDIETLRLHYAWTLQHWYDRTVAHQTEIEALYDARFYRMWCFYLAGALTSFSHGGLCNYQIQFARSRHALPYTRDYLSKTEAALRE